MIIFSDMDGTFLDTRKHVGPAGWQALDALAAAGLEFVPCTGRPLSGIPADVLAHPAVHYAVSSNGAVIARLDGERPQDTSRATTLHLAGLSRAKAHEIWEIARDYDVTFDIFAGGDCYTQRSMYDRLEEYVADPHIVRALRATRIPLEATPEAIIDGARDLERVAIYWKDPVDRDAIRVRLAAVDGIEVTRSYSMNIEVMAAGTSKGSALRWLCAELGISTSEAVAFGDNMNDVSMLQIAGTGVAMQNAEDAVRAAADAVAASNDADGAGLFILDLLARA
ncbi:Cof-type HAD-IIB family hydrolase [Collinsella sp. BA40]|uniref:Cof-type HAD-IIB family hydrolase n=1 Tax=Collinsella sp. BA40 TaxID=2560852 RepID=UPI0011CC73DC|nr:Cof-type HAD-IIB family hydrolase [Collinsella sp. BA40]TXF35482.1 Cof-type HAD-IIB family hydrolase [Collinsella sp. BA40]